MKNEIRKELESLQSDLANQKNRTGFSVPENYFEKLESKVMAKTEKTVVRSISPLKKWGWIAAAAAVLFAIGMNFLTQELPTDVDPLADITEEEASMYITENLDDFTDEELLDLLDDVDFTFE